MSRSNRSQSVIVVGAGVIGLTTALRLLEAGYAVQVVAHAFPPHTTSNLAAAVWYPFLVEPRDRVRRWAQATRIWYGRLLNRPETGVRPIDLTILAPEPLWWVEELPPDLWLRVDDHDSHARLFRYSVRTLLVETPIFMAHLMDAVSRLGGTFLEQRIDSLDELASPDLRAVVNCTGLGAARLVDDAAVYPVAGHILPFTANAALPYVMDERVDELGTVCYIFPRQDLCVVGGSEVVGACDKVDPRLVRRIRSRARVLAPDLADDLAGVPYVGLRPGRDHVRLERDAGTFGPDGRMAVVHNYGHGGGGFTLCWGCADEVLRLLDA